MKKFGFGDNFSKWISLYTNPKASIITNNIVSSSFDLHRGICQGCTRSPVLFAIAIEPLAIYVRQNEKIHGVYLGKKQQKIMLYADDVILTLSQPELSLMEIPLYRITYLGIRIPPKLVSLYPSIIKPLIVQVKKDLTCGSTLPVSFLGRINVIKMIPLPRILYILSMSFLQFSLNDLKIKMDVLQNPGVKTLGMISMLLHGKTLLNSLLLFLFAINLEKFNIANLTNRCHLTV
uniref:Uncharacterized protein n=1 Tax=Sinocyclocheilus anshuiensis TaxID=1608454 RepID=A0A671SVL6_9TELE